MLAPHHEVATKLDHYFLATRPPTGAERFAGRLIDPWTLCRLGWWIRGSTLELIRYGPQHLAILVTYPGIDHPNIEVSLHTEHGRMWLELEGVYLFALKGLGLGSCAMWHCALAAQRLGCRYIAVQASGVVTRDEGGDIGYYAWPRMGFDAPLRLAMQSRLASAAPDMLHCRTVREALEHDKEVWRAAAATVPLTFHLGDDSPDLTYLRRYLAQRRLLA